MRNHGEKSGASADEVGGIYADHRGDIVGGVYILWGIPRVYRIQPRTGAVFYLVWDQSWGYRFPAPEPREWDIWGDYVRVVDWVDYPPVPSDFDQERIQEKEDYRDYIVDIHGDYPVLDDHSLGIPRPEDQCDGLPESQWWSPDL